MLSSLDRKELIDYCFTRGYKLKDVSEKEKKFVLSHKGIAVSISEFSEDVKKTLVLRGPCIFYESSQIAQKYIDEVYSNFKDSFTPPRGFVGDNVCIICGIAPGYSKLSFSEPKWLYGPSSELLHKMLVFNWRWYFTNVCKEPFNENEYDDNKAREWASSLVMELLFFQKNVKNSKLVFLGTYPIYMKIKELILIPSISIYHPSYLLKSPSKIQIEKNKLKEFLK